MKNLKIKLGLFSLLAVLAASVFFTACQQEEILTESITDVNLTDAEAVNFILPWGYDKEMSAEEEAEYINSIDDETFDKLIQSSTILDYFISLDKAQVLADNSAYGDIFGENTLSSYLTKEEIKNFDSFTGLDQNIESRWGCDCGSWYYYETKCGCFGPGCRWGYLRYDRYKKECHAWYCPDRFEERNHRQCN